MRLPNEAFLRGLLLVFRFPYLPGYRHSIIARYVPLTRKAASFISICTILLLLHVSLLLQSLFDTVA